MWPNIDVHIYVYDVNAISFLDIYLMLELKEDNYELMGDK